MSTITSPEAFVVLITTSIPPKEPQTCFARALPIVWLELWPVLFKVRLNSTVPEYKLVHRLPEIVGIEKSREFGINVDHMHIAFLVVPDHCFIIVASAVDFNIDTKRSIHLQFKSVRRDL